MKYIAKPVIVDAYKIVQVKDPVPLGIPITLENGQNVLATNEMISRMHPIENDYWVIQEDGYVYINPRKVFERKYKAIE